MRTSLPDRITRIERIALATTVLGLSLGSIGFNSTVAQAAPAGGPGAISSSTAGAVLSGSIPDGTCRAAMSLLGANGGSSTASGATGGVGGSGARIAALFDVLPQQAYTGTVGGGGNGTAGGVGYAAGGAGGTGTGHRGFGGGGATGFKVAGIPMIIAGGGGGGSAAHQAAPNGYGGHAGFAIAAGVVAPGSTGTAGTDTPTTPSGGQGGQATAGGAGGTNTGTPSTNGSAGAGIGVGTGGNGGPDPSLDTAGGGGGGYTGGGGGASTATTNATGGGGGGGSSWLAATSPTASASVPKAVSGAQGPAMPGGSVTGTVGSINVDWQPCVYDLSVTKSVSDKEVYQGGKVVWTVSVRNNGPDYMTRGDTVDLTDTLPTGPNAAGTSFKVLSFDVSGGSNTDLASGPVTCTGLAVGSSLPSSTTCSRPYQSVAGTPGSPGTGTRGLDVGETITITYEQQLAASATCPAKLTNTATITDRASSSGTTDVVGVVTSNSTSASFDVKCGAKLTLIKAFGGPRSAADHQFTMSITPDGAAPAGSSATTTGTGSTVDPNTGIVVATAVPGSPYTFNETGLSLGGYEKTISCTGASAQTTVPKGVIALPFTITPNGGDDIVCTLTNTPYPYSLTILKSADTSGPLTLGSGIPYTFTVTNTGKRDFDSFTVTDPQVSNITCSSTDLPVDKSSICTGTHTVTQADIDAGQIINTAGVSATSPGLPPYSDSSNTVTTPIPQNPKISITKSSPTNSYANVGDPIDYEFTVVNEGDTTLNAITVTDPQVTGLTCAATSLAPGKSTTCTATRSATQDDLNKGKVVNTASVAADTPGGTPVTNTSNTVEVPAKQTPALTVTKSAQETSFDTVGQTVNYTFEVTNTGNVTVDNVAIADPNAAGLSCTPTTLNPGEKAACVGTHTVTQNDIDAGALINTANVSADDSNGASISALSNTITIPSTQNPQLSVKKSASLTSISAVGEEIEYTIEVTNNGNVTLHDVSVTDPIAAPITCPTGDVAPTKSVTCTGKHIVTLADLNAGSVINVAAASALLPDGTMTPTTNSNQVTVPAVQKPSLSIDKSAGQPSYTTLGETVTYTFKVTNTGNVTLTAVGVSDPKTTGVTCDKTTLDPTEVATCTGPHIVTQTDLDNGKLDNTAQASASDPSGQPLAPVDSNTVSLPADQKPSATIVKSADVSSYRAVGDVVSYKFVVTNTGNVTLYSLAIGDPVVPNVSCPQTTLAPAATVECSATKTITQADLDGGKIVNTATLGANDPSGSPLTPVPSNTVTVPAIMEPKLSIVKATTTTSFDTIGQQVPYTFEVTNTGNVTMTAVGVVDPMIDPITCDVSTLLPGAKASCTGTYTVKAADLDRGKLTNTATTSGTSPDGQVLPPVSSNTVEVPAIQKPSLAIVKSSATPSFSVLGETVTYNFTVTNTGNVTITGVVVNDAKVPSVTCAATTLAAGATTQCTGIHTVTQADLDTGSIVNTAAVGGSGPDSSVLPSTPSNTITIPAVQSPAITIEKASPTTAFANVGDVITYSFTVTNKGNVTMHDVKVTDPKVSGVTCPVSTLAPGEATVCTGSYAVTQADLDNTIRTNTASVNALDPTNTATGPQSSNTVNVPADPKPSLAITKSVTNAAPTKAGDKVAYEFVVTNTGNLTLNNVTVTDANAIDIACPRTTLSPTESMTCTAEHVATQAEVDAGKITNKAEVFGTPQVGAPTTPAPSNEVVVPITPAPKLSIAKQTSTASYKAVGDLINYDFIVTNEGNVTLVGVQVNDPIVAGITCPKQTLAPGESTTCSGSRAATQADLDGAAIINTASVQAVAPGGTPVAPVNSNTVTVPAVQTPALTITKATPTQNVAIAGTRIPYSFEVTNTGNVTLNSIAIADPNAEQINCPITQIAPQQTVQCSALHVVTQTDVDSGAVINQATVSGKGPQGNPAPSVDSNPVTVPMIQKPSLSIQKSTDAPSFNTLGETINYSFTVTNDGNVTMHDIAVTDPTTTAVTCLQTTLAPTASTTCSSSHVVTQADLDRGSIVNTAKVRGTDPKGVVLPPVDSNTITVPAVQTPKLTMAKRTPTASVKRVGETIPYEFTVTNAGNVTIHDIAVSDANATGLSCAQTTLAPLETTTCSGSHTVTQADLDGVKVVNTATVDGTGPSDLAVPTATSNTVTVPSEQLPALTINKAADASTYSARGDTVTYSFVVKNEGNVTTKVTVRDPNVTSISCPVVELAPAESVTCTAKRTVDQRDLDAGAIINTASVSGVTAAGAAVAPVPSNTITIPATQQPKLSVVKTADKESLTKAGEVVTYSFTIKNKGNVTLSNVALTDPMVSGLTCDRDVLAPGASATCSGTHKLTQEEVDAGEVRNQATATAKTPDRKSLSPTPSNEVVIPVPPKGKLTIVKKAGLAAFFKVGQQIDYTFSVTNEGNVTLSDIAVSDPLVSAITCQGTVLQPSKEMVCTASHTVTQKDLNTGSFVNTAAVTGKEPSGATLPAASSNTVTVPATAKPQLAIAKSTSKKLFKAVGESVDFTMVVTNEGNVTLSNVVVSDPVVGTVTCEKSELEPKGETTCVGSHAVTQADLDAGKIVNTATVRAQTPKGTAVDATSNTVTVVGEIPVVVVPTTAPPVSTTLPVVPAPVETLPVPVVPVPVVPVAVPVVPVSVVSVPVVSVPASQPSPTTTPAIEPSTTVKRTPAITNDSAEVTSSTHVGASVFGNDAARKPQLVRYTQPAHGSVEMDADGTYVYIPTPGYEGTDEFTYTIIDADGNEFTAKVTVKVKGIQISSPTPSDLAFTGRNALAVLSLGSALVLGGALIVLLSRRKRLRA